MSMSMNTKWPTYIQHTVYLTCGHCGAEEGGYTCSPVCRFRRNHYGSEMCAIVHQVFNGVSDETQRMFTYFCFCVCACLYVRVSTDVHIALHGHGDHLLHPSYRCRPPSWLHLPFLDFCQNLSVQLLPHLL